MFGFGMPEIKLIGIIVAVVIVAVTMNRMLVRQKENSSKSYNPNPASSTSKFILPIILIVLAGGGYFLYSHSSMRVSKKMTDLAIELTKKIHSDRAGFGFGALHPRAVTISRIDLIEIGESREKTLPVRFHIVGELKTQENKTDASSFPIRLSVEDVVKPIDDTVVYIFSKDEFNKQVVCDESRMVCLKEI